MGVSLTFWNEHQYVPNIGHRFGSQLSEESRGIQTQYGIVFLLPLVMGDKFKLSHKTEEIEFRKTVYLWVLQYICYIMIYMNYIYITDNGLVTKIYVKWWTFFSFFVFLPWARLLTCTWPVHIKDKWLTMVSKSAWDV